MKRKITVLVNLALLAMLSSTVLCSQIKSPVANLAVTGRHKEEVVDPAYGMTAFTIEVPSGWKFAGFGVLTLVAGIAAYWIWSRRAHESQGRTD